MNTYYAYDWILDFIRIMGVTIQGIFTMPVFNVGGTTVHIGQLLIFDFIATLILKFAINLPTEGITTNARISRKNDPGVRYERNRAYKAYSNAKNGRWSDGGKYTG